MFAQAGASFLSINFTLEGEGGFTPDESVRVSASASYDFPVVIFGGSGTDEVTVVYQVPIGSVQPSSV